MCLSVDKEDIRPFDCRATVDIGDSIAVVESRACETRDESKLADRGLGSRVLQCGDNESSEISFLSSERLTVAI